MSGGRHCALRRAVAPSGRLRRDAAGDVLTFCCKLVKQNDHLDHPTMVVAVKWQPGPGAGGEIDAPPRSGAGPVVGTQWTGTVPLWWESAWSDAAHPPGPGGGAQRPRASARPPPGRALRERRGRAHPWEGPHHKPQTFAVAAPTRGRALSLLGARRGHAGPGPSLRHRPSPGRVSGARAGRRCGRGPPSLPRARWWPSPRPGGAAPRGRSAAR